MRFIRTSRFFRTSRFVCTSARLLCWMLLCWMLHCGMLHDAGVENQLQAQEVFFPNGDVWPVVPMSSERAEDAYAIYSLLVPGEFPNTLLEHHPQWLIANMTIVVDDAPNDPRKSITVPPSQEKAFAAVLQDYDKQRHVHVQLERNFHLSVPYQLMDTRQRGEFLAALGTSSTTQTNRLPVAYQDALGLIYFSNVYFNFEHTLAMVYEAGWCGSNCGQMGWVVLQKVNGRWAAMPWTTSFLRP